MNGRGMQIALVVAVAVWATLAGAPSAGFAGQFDESIRALLKERCVRCHGPNRRRGDLDLSSAAGLRRGGDGGRDPAAGGLESSLLWRRVEAGEMPPDRPLEADELGRLRDWIAAGAPGLAAVGDEGDDDPFRPLVGRPAPSVRDGSRWRTFVDAPLQARLEARGLTLGPDAGRAVLLRRVAWDSTGLPPSPEEIREFEADDDPDAYERMVDRYLASPRFAERWGKQWLDAAGYADSNGYFSADTDRPLAYRYRDYVIRAFRQDKPFDRFVREQLAGDELARFKPGEPTTEATIELLEATHFLRNGQDGTDIGVQEPEAFEIDRRAALEAAVQVTASSLLGLTLHCARCHDHKFEPITQREYYAFQAILFPAFNPQDWINPKDRTIYAYLPGEKEEWQEHERRIGAELNRLQDDYRRWIAANREPSELLLHETFDDEGWKRRWSATAPGDDRPSGAVAIDGAGPPGARVDAGRLQLLAGPGEAWLSSTTAFDWTPESKGDWIQATFDLIADKVGGGAAERIGYVIAAHDYDDSGERAGGNLLVDGHPSAATSVYRDYPGADQKVIGSIGGRGHAPGLNVGVRVVNAGDGKYSLEHLIDGTPDGAAILLTAEDLPDGGFAWFYCCNRSYVVDELRVERSRSTGPESLDPATLAARRRAIADRRAEYDRTRKELEGRRRPEPGRAIAWVSDKSERPPVVPLLARGQYHLRGENVAPDALRTLTDAGRDYRPAPPEGMASTGRRAGLADWMLHPEGRPAALLARVQVNRIWANYFGRGIVATTDNLGRSGAAPSHPELLDELALRFVRGGWSQRALHREILSSTAYRQSSAPHAAGLAVDPDNRLHWRRSIRRLDAEAVRDGMLAAAGLLDGAAFGPYVPTRQTAVGEVVVDPATPGARRRSVYLQQRRSQTLSLLRVFDAPSIATVCTSRPSSTVPLQSLALLNSDFALACADGLAERLSAERRAADATGAANGATADSVAATVGRAWRIVAGREPTNDERKLAETFLAEQRGTYEGPDAERRELADFCQMLLASNAFLYVE